ncbi:MAG: S8 family serine peptidase [candidate division Zixibacteria bacterium]|nr:S8 family serine peptidase [candidate division Zixibacteria bacterium]
MSKSKICLWAVLFLFLFSFNTQADAESKAVLKLNPGTDAREVSQTITDMYGGRFVSLSPVYPHRITKPALREYVKNLYYAGFESVSISHELCGRLGDIPGVVYAEPIPSAELMYEPDDPRYGDQWYLPHIECNLAWDIVRGEQTESSIIAIIDTGLNYELPEFEDNLWINEPEDINNNGTFENYPEEQGGDLNNADDDGNGFVDDVIGYDFGFGDPSPQEESIFHGTSVAGMASMVTDNDFGGASAGFSAKIMTVKVFRAGNMMNHITGMIYAAENGAHFINCSWGTSSYSQSFQDLVNAIAEDGAIVVASGGDGQPNQPIYPCAYNNVLCVAPTDENDIIYYADSNPCSVDVWAPGVNVLVSTHGGNFTYMSGASFSSSLTAGVMALVKAVDTSLTGLEVARVIIDGADDISQQNPYYDDPKRINAYNSVQRTAVEPKPPTGIWNDMIGLFPSPFNEVSVIELDLPVDAEVNLTIYNILGQEVTVIVDQYLSAGRYTYRWNASGQISGVYFCRLMVEGRSETKKLVLLK